MQYKPSDGNIQKTALIIGAGPAGLTAAYELLARTDIVPIVVECSAEIGGLSKTLNYKGNRIDLGGHRFFSKSQRIKNWWQSIFPLESSLRTEEFSNEVMLVRTRRSRILYLRKLFDYPLSLSMKTFQNLGFFRLFKIIASYLKARLKPIQPEIHLEAFFINRFGYELYNTFFKDYTEKVWGVPCQKIKAEWGAQRVKGLSMTKAFLDALKRCLGLQNPDTVETSLIESFWYPPYGPGQLWEKVASLIQTQGGQLHLQSTVIKLKQENDTISEVTVLNQQTNETTTYQPEYVFSTMPLQDLIQAMAKQSNIPEEVQKTALGLQYRDFITVGVLLHQLSLQGKSIPTTPCLTNTVATNTPSEATRQHCIQDNWLYIQEKDVRVGRIQIYNNWSPHLVADPNTVWLGLEYFCNEGDAFWTQSDDVLKELAIKELVALGIAQQEDVIDEVVIRVPKAYPAYWGSYEHLHIIKQFLNGIHNLYVLGRNGMHKYNNADHSMLTAMVAVDTLLTDHGNKESIWQVNTEQEYHEAISQN